MTNRIFQDEINASEQIKIAEAEQQAAQTDSTEASRLAQKRQDVDPLADLQRTSVHEIQRVNSFQDIWDRTFAGEAQYRVIDSTQAGRDPLTGNPVYYVTALSPWGTMTQRTFMVQDGRFVEPSSFAPDLPTGEEPGGISGLDTAKQQWVAWVTEMLDNDSLTPAGAAGLISQIQNFNGTHTELNEWMRFVENNTFGAFPDVSPVFGDPGLGLGFSGGGGGGFSGPQYRAPDRRVVEDFVKGTMVSLVGTVLSGDLERIVDLYMNDHRRGFNSVSQDIDPQASVIEAIRSTPLYKQVHKLRPESQDERTWVSSRRSAAIQGGLDLPAQEGFAITQASAAGDLGDVAQAASVAQVQRSGAVRGTLLERTVGQVANSIFKQVRV
jgi:hypothetical protein